MKYREGLPEQFRKQAVNLAQLTGWSLDDIHRRMGQSGQSVRGEK